LGSHLSATFCVLAYGLMNTEMQKRALAARDAHLALLDLRRVVDEAAQSTHAVELEAVHLAMSPRAGGDISSPLREILERLGSDIPRYLQKDDLKACLGNGL
jgi:hypothetical protein